MVVKTFRGLIDDGGQDRIYLQTNDGRTGYRIVKFELLFRAPGTQSTESVVKIYKSKQTAIDAIINFSENSMLAAGFLSGDGAAHVYPEDTSVIFDREIFNQDIYVTHSEVSGSEPVNYYIELEVIDLSSLAAEYTTLKDIKARNTG